MFKVLDEVCTPTKGSKYSACIDLRAREDVVISAGETVKVPLGVCVRLEELLYYLGYIIIDTNGEVSQVDNKIIEIFLKSNYLQLEPRSSLRAKGLQAGTGIIDLDYKDEIMIILHNPFRADKSQESLEFKINKGKKIAQIMLCEHKSYLFGIETEEERTGGFGSTGEK